MNNLISREKLKSCIRRIAIDESYKRYEVESIINEQPAVEAKEVIHGHWQGVSPLVDSLECSECRYEILSEELKTPYCPWCGAKMDEVSE